MKMFRLAVVTLLISLVLPTGLLAADIDAGYAAHSRGDYAAALREFRPLAEQGNASAQTSLGFMYSKGRGVQQDHAEALMWYRKAANQNYAQAQYNLGIKYRKGEGVRQDYAEAARWYRKAAEQDNAQAQYNLGLLYANGQGVHQDYAEAARWYRKAAGQGLAIAQNILGLLYADGQGVRQDHAEAVKWYRKAANQNYAQAQSNLGMSYADGKGVQQDYAEAVSWYRKAAEQDNANGQTNMGFMYYNGQGVQQNYTEALKWYRKAAEQDKAPAQATLGLMYYNGEGVKRDYTEALKWYRKAANQGDASAQSSVGLIYYLGQGVRQDYTAALRWFRKAANQGDASGQTSLGFMYAKGHGVQQDRSEALIWYRKAANQNYSRAQFNLGLSYAAGKGVQQNYTEAHKWFNLASAQGLEKASKSRKLIEQKMTVKQIAEAKLLAREWKPDKQPLTKVPLSNYAAPNTIPNAKEINRRTQVRLATLGYDPGQADGIVGPKTRAAIRAFQVREGLKVTGTVSPSLSNALEIATVGSVGSASEQKTISLKLIASGSGFFVSAEGHILTNEHVVRGCREVRVPPAVVVSIIAQEESTDLAVLKNAGTARQIAVKFRGGRGIRSGDNIVVLGYPLRGVLASEVNVTSGEVSALAGPGDDRRFFQITAPVQPGNSGGPVLDKSGNAVGVVMSKLNAIKVARATGDIPQNVNFAVSAGTARTFLDAHNVPYETAASVEKFEPADIAATARKFTLPIECWK